MAQTSGTIHSISVFGGFCCVRVLDVDTGSSSYLLLWSYSAQEDNATNRLLHGQFLSLTRDALINNRTVTFGHDSGSALIESMVIT